MREGCATTRETHYRDSRTVRDVANDERTIGARTLDKIKTWIVHGKIALRLKLETIKSQTEDMCSKEIH